MILTGRPIQAAPSKEKEGKEAGCVCVHGRGKEGGGKEEEARWMDEEGLPGEGGGT